MYPVACIVVLAWNQRDLTLDCLKSLAALDYPRQCLQLVVVDNGSKDGTSQAIQVQHPDVTILRNQENLGYAGGNNVGIAHALQSQSDYIMLLNNDTVVDAQMLHRLISAAECDEHAGIVTPMIYHYDQRDLIWCAGASTNWRTGAVRRLQAEEVDAEPETDVRYVESASGCAICFKRQVIEEIGLLDPRFYLYYEETDWCARAQAAGWRILYVPTARLWHKVSASIETASPAIDYYMTRNLLLFLAKNQTGWARARTLVQAFGRNLLTIAAYTVKPHDGRRLPHRTARLLALRDAILERWGMMGPEVAAVCELSHEKE